MGSKQELRQLQQFNYKLYRKLARVIHSKLCVQDGWCNYGKPGSENLRLRTAEDGLESKPDEIMQFCQYAVDAENIAARVQFGKGSKVRT